MNSLPTRGARLEQIDHVTIRGFVPTLRKGLSKTGGARAGGGASLYRWLAQKVRSRESGRPGLDSSWPQNSRVPTIEMVCWTENAGDRRLSRARRMMLELLYGCGIRNSN
jgi:site-specific recombinase XerD